jgi:hypothetical protein
VKDATKVSLVDHDNVIKALAANRTDEAFNVRVLPWGLRCRDNFFNADVGHTPLKIQTTDAIAITDQESRSGLFGKRFNDLLRSPCRRWMGRHIEMNDAPTIVVEDG